MSSKREAMLKRSLLVVGAATLAVLPVLLLLTAPRQRPARAPRAAPAPAAPTPSGFARWCLRNTAALQGGVRVVRTWTIHYRVHDGARRVAFVVLPRWYGPRNNPPIPLVLSAHGRGIGPGANARIWGNLPALGRFAVVNPQGQGNRLELYAWGSQGESSDLARMPSIVRRALPWLRIAPHRVYAVGGLGSQEILLLVAEYPRLLAGAVSFDAPTNMAARYAAFAQLRDGLGLQVVRVVGTWRQTAELHPTGRMPLALARLGLLPIGTAGPRA
jgi:hypothetical protein